MYVGRGNDPIAPQATNPARPPSMHGSYPVALSSTSALRQQNKKMWGSLICKLYVHIFMGTCVSYLRDRERC